MAENSPDLHNLIGCCDFRTLRRLLKEHRPFSPQSKRTRRFSTALSLYSQGLYSLEGLIHNRRIRAHELAEPPTFIVGHWRSGTTFLHNVIHRSQRFSSIDLAQSLRIRSTILMGNVMRKILTDHAPEDREFDGVAIAHDEPQEEEMALTTLGMTSTYHQGMFPRDRKEIINGALYPENLSVEDYREFSGNYLWLAKKISYIDEQHRPLLFKNPAATARIDFLREIFPEAKFIHIIRRPADVMRSFAPTLKTLFGHYSLHGIYESPPMDTLIEEYTRLMQAHLKQRDHLLDKDYIEVRYEDFRQAPLKTVDQIYQHFGWDFTDAQRQNISEYLKSISDYKRNKREPDPELEAELESKLSFAYDQWSYDRKFA